jgi:hypothetical protein
LSADCGESVYDGESSIDRFDPLVISPPRKCGGVFIMISLGEEVSGTKRFRGPGEPAHSRTTSKSATVIPRADGAAHSACSIDGASSNKSSGK